MKSPGKAMLGRSCFHGTVESLLKKKNNVRKMILANVQISRQNTGNKKLYRKLMMKNFIEN